MHLCHMTAAVLEEGRGEVLEWGGEGNTPGGAVAAATASEHTRNGVEKQGLKGICSPSAPMIISDWLLQLATTPPLFFCFEMSPIPQQEAASISHVSKETKTWSSSTPNYAVLSSGSQPSRAREQARLLLKECSAFFPLHLSSLWPRE